MALLLWSLLPTRSHHRKNCSWTWLMQPCPPHSPRCQQNHLHLLQPLRMPPPQLPRRLQLPRILSRLVRVMGLRPVPPLLPLPPLPPPPPLRQASRRRGQKLALHTRLRDPKNPFDLWLRASPICEFSGLR
ncbi:unnamed protein product [Dibothriocephalus latus]|uniref:Uncharacterized protein n=1 Tax=Dibothriocephalus latus TaxID=60516 RepID=A0A3P7QRF6_DIBLA|nr:unnamed protein product [Dibothriocephalus latus]